MIGTKEMGNFGVEAARLLKTVIEIGIATDARERFERFRDDQREQILKRVASTAEVITDPESPGLAEFVAKLHKQFRSGEVEGLSIFQDELRSNGSPDPKAHYICIVLRDPLNGEMVSGAYGSIDRFGTLAIRFTLTEASYLGEPPDSRADEKGFGGFRGYRGTGISQEADRLLMEEAREFGDKEIKAMVGEAIGRSEAYWNKIELEPDNGNRRLYRQQPDGGKNEFKYRLPPLSWNPDGTPASREMEEHLQIAVRGYKDQIPASILKEIIRNWWETWYIRRKEQFNDETAWQKHVDVVWAVFENLFKDIPDSENLMLRTRDETD